MFCVESSHRDLDRVVQPFRKQHKCSPAANVSSNAGGFVNALGATALLLPLSLLPKHLIHSELSQTFSHRSIYLPLKSNFPTDLVLPWL